MYCGDGCMFDPPANPPNLVTQLDQSDYLHLSPEHLLLLPYSNALLRALQQSVTACLSSPLRTQLGVRK